MQMNVSLNGRRGSFFVPFFLLAGMRMLWLELEKSSWIMKQYVKDDNKVRQKEPGTLRNMEPIY